MTGPLLLVAVVLVLLTAAWFSWTAGRLDRLHLRCEGAAAALDAALAARRALALEAAAQPTTDPASAVLLADAATDSGHTYQVESNLSAVLRAVRPEPPRPEPWDELVAVGERVQVARRIHNDLVATTLALRERRRVRWFRLAGHAPAPEMVAFDDAVAAPADGS